MIDPRAVAELQSAFGPNAQAAQNHPPQQQQQQQNSDELGGLY